MFKRYSDNSHNIFKQISKGDNDCFFINCQCNQDCYCDKFNSNIRRLCFDPDICNHESYVYLTLLTKNSDIPCLMSIKNNEIIYHLKDHSSLRNYLWKNFDNITLIMNELFVFINRFKDYKYVHGNLHIDNIFVDNINSYDMKIKFHVIDFCNSYIENDSIKKCKYKRTSFLREYEIKKEILYYWDFCSIYISLSMFLNNPKITQIDTIKILEYIKSIIISYIGKERFENFIKDYEEYLNTEHYNKIKIKYHSI